jgi:hypothetical protein
MEKPENNNSDLEDIIEDDDFLSEDEKRLNLPKKSKYRMRAHCNPLAEITIP